MELDKDTAISTFVERKTQNEGSRTNNSASYAGSPMYYYCKHCDDHTQTLPESHRERPITICTPCKVLDEHGLIPKALTAYRATKQ